MDERAPDKVQFSVWIPSDLRDRLRAYAQKTGLTLAAVCTILLTEGVVQAEQRLEPKGISQ